MRHCAVWITFTILKKLGFEAIGRSKTADKPFRKQFRSRHKKPMRDQIPHRLFLFSSFLQKFHRVAVLNRNQILTEERENRPLRGEEKCDLALKKHKFPVHRSIDQRHPQKTDPKASLPNGKRIRVFFRIRRFNEDPFPFACDERKISVLPPCATVSNFPDVCKS